MPLHVCFTSKLGQSGVRAELSDKGHNQISTRNPRNRRLFKARKTLRALPVWAPTGASSLLERDRQRRPVESSAQQEGRYPYRLMPRGSYHRKTNRAALLFGRCLGADALG